MQKEHDLFDLFLFFPCLGDLPGAFWANAGDIPQLLRLVFDDLQGVLFEVVHNPFCELGADAFDQHGAQVALEAFDCGGQGLSANLDRKLGPILNVGAPATLKREEFAGGDFKQVPDDGSHAVVREARNVSLIRLEAQHGVAIEVGDADCRTGEFVYVPLRGGLVLLPPGGGERLFF